MTFKRSMMRYAHTTGHTGCVYTNDGESFITYGTDGDIRIWQGIDDDDPSSKCLGEFVLALVQYEKRMLVSTDLNVVQAYTFPEGDRDGTEMRFTAPVTCIKVNKNYIAACSEDTDIKFMPKDKSESESMLSGHQGPVLHIDLSVKNLLASSSGDGTIKIWDLAEKKEIKTISGLPKVNTFDMVKSYVSPCFDPPTGRMLAYVHGKEVIVLNASTWEVKTTLSDDNVTGMYTICSFSLCGQYLAAGTDAGEISVWNVKKSQSLKGDNAGVQSNRITAIAWNPKNNGELTYCDSTGEVGTVFGCDGSETDENEDANDFLNAEAVEDDAESDMDGLHFADNDDDADGENVISLERIKNDTMRANGLVEDEDTKDSLLKSERSSPERAPVKMYHQQGPFQPGSTPSDLEHRYLVWNNVGIVRSHNNDAEGTIDVEFHDTNIHQALHMNNYHNHTMASLSSTVLALSGDSSSKLVCIVLGTSSREWSVEFPDCESAVALVATNSLVAVATDTRYLRVFSAMGTQRHVISIPGPIVSLTGHGEKLFVAYHGAPASEDQHIMAMFIQFFGLNIRCKEAHIPLPQGKKLTWIGFSDRGSPVMCDTMGMVQLFSIKSNMWLPVCDTMKHTQSVSNNFFIIDVVESSQIVQAVLCRGTSYPMTNPRPMLTELRMQVPLCELESDKSQLEETLIRYSTFNVERSEIVIKETATKLFAHACRAEMEARAKELIEMIASPQLLSLAVKYANKLGRIHLVDKLGELLPHIEQQEKQREKEMQENDVEIMNVIQNSPLNAGLLMMQKKNSVESSQSQISPKPMVISNQRRNPFKRTSTGSVSTPNAKTTTNISLSHLTEKAIGFQPRKSLPQQQQTINKDASSSSAINSFSEFDEGAGPSGINTRKAAFETNNIDSDEESMDLGTTQDSEVIPSSIKTDENKSKKEETSTTPSSIKNFANWYNLNKDNLKAKHPNLTGQELAKLALKEHKAIISNGVVNTSSNGIACTSDSPARENGISQDSTAGQKNELLNGKRKLEETSGQKSGVSKLAKFAFKN